MWENLFVRHVPNDQRKVAESLMNHFVGKSSQYLVNYSRKFLTINLQIIGGFEIDLLNARNQHVKALETRPIGNYTRCRMWKWKEIFRLFTTAHTKKFIAFQEKESWITYKHAFHLFTAVFFEKSIQKPKERERKTENGRNKKKILWFLIFFNIFTQWELKISFSFSFLRCH